MKGFHVTYYEYLDSILMDGLIPHKTTECNFPFADDNRHINAVFFMVSKESSHSWFCNFHPRDYRIDKESGLAEEEDRGISVMIEFDLPENIKIFPDPYQEDSGTMKDSFYILQTISPECIVDIHDPIQE